MGVVVCAGVLALTTTMSGAIGGRHHHRQKPPPPQADPNGNCTLVLPRNPLSARGLATPFQLTATNRRDGACHESNPDQEAFVQGTIIDPKTGQLSVYNPLVIDAGTRPAVAPTVPKLPAGAVVGLWFGFNADTLALRGPGNTLAAANCVNGLNGSLFGQFSFCNAKAFFAAADRAIRTHQLRLPPLGKANDGKPCPTTRDFGVVDQDQSDNVTATYVLTRNGRLAQNTDANRAALPDARVVSNGSDNLLLDQFLDPALGCTPMMAPDLADGGKPATALALNELQAELQKAPVALTPLNDPMVLVNGRMNQRKTNLYRSGVDQGLIDLATETPKQYCRDFVRIGAMRTQLDRNATSTADSPDPEAADSLFTFLASRLEESYGNLGCDRMLGTDQFVTLTTNAEGVVVDAKFPGEAQQPAPAPSTTPTNTPSPIPTPVTGDQPTPMPPPSDLPTATPSGSAPATTDPSTSPSGQPTN